MTRSEATKKLHRLLGNKAGYRVDDAAPSPDAREEAMAALPAARAERERLEKAKRERAEYLLVNDTEYQDLKAAHATARKQEQSLSGCLSRFKFTVGTSEGMFFVVKAQGGSWEEVFAKLNIRRAA